MKSLIQTLVEIPGPSGHESQVRQAVRDLVEPIADEVRFDALGNLIARKGQLAGGGMRIMLAAHLDEIGVMVTHVDENGFARFTTIGGVRTQYCPGVRVRFLNGARGVVGIERQDNSSKPPEIDQMYIDLGLSSRKDSKVRVGDVAAFRSPIPGPRGPHGSKIDG